LLAYQSAPKVIHLSELASGKDLQEYLAVLVDETNHLEIEDVRNADFKTPRTLKDHDYPDYLDYTFWMKFQVQHF